MADRLVVCANNSVKAMITLKLFSKIFLIVSKVLRFITGLNYYKHNNSGMRFKISAVKFNAYSGQY